MRRAITYILLLLGSLDVWGESRWSVDNLTDPYTVNMTYVLDELGYLNQQERDAINNICEELNGEADLETAVVMLDEIDDDPFDFAYELYDKWELGRDDRGILLLLVMEQHEWQFISGYGAEADYPDILLGQIGRNKIVPQFREGNYYLGIRDALAELLKVANDTIYKEDNYNISQLYQNEEEDGDVFNNYNHQEDVDFTYADSLIFVWIIFVLFVGPALNFYLGRSPSLKEASKGVTIKKPENGDDNTAEITYIKKPTQGWTSWSGWRALIRYFLFDAGIVFAWAIAYDSPDNAGFVLLVYYLYFIVYGSVLWILATFIEMRRGSSSESEIYQRADLISSSTTLKILAVVAPMVSWPFIWYIRRKVKIHVANVMRCPICNEAITDTHVVYEAKTPSEKFLIDNEVLKYDTFECGNGHITTIRTQGANYHKFSDCTKCGNRGRRETSQERTEEPTSTSSGTLTRTYTCGCCGAIDKKTECIPIPGSSSGGGSYGYSGGGSYGGSRGGGRSGGGGAGGRW